jgi:hypothetical protein
MEIVEVTIPQNDEVRTEIFNTLVFEVSPVDKLGGHNIIGGGAFLNYASYVMTPTGKPLSKCRAPVRKYLIYRKTK